MAMASHKSIRVFPVDDSVIAREGIRAILGLDPALKVIGEAATKADAVALSYQLKPDVVIMDLRLPDGSGIEACREILTAAPRTRILFFSANHDIDAFNQAIGAGAHGFVSKGVGARDLIQAIKTVAAGRSVLDGTGTDWVFAQLRHLGANERTPPSLSQEERHLLSLLAGGHTNKEIAGIEHIPPTEVKARLSALYRKLRVSRRTQVVHFALTQRSASKGGLCET